MTSEPSHAEKSKLHRWASKARDWVARHVPPGVRTLLGVFFIACGLVGFLPIVGFWMLPLGVGLIVLDMMQLGHFVRGTTSKKPETHTKDDADRLGGPNSDKEKRS